MQEIKKLIEEHVIDYQQLDIITCTATVANLRKVLKILKEDINTQFTQLVDLCAVDYIEYGISEWQTREATNTGYNRGINPTSHSRIDIADDTDEDEYNLCVVYHLLSLNKNLRLRVKCFLDKDSLIIPSVTDLFASADWYEREAYDLYGVLFDGHDDLRRILTDYGFEGHPLRKDFPLTGHTEVRSSQDQKKVINEPVKLEQNYRNFDYESPWEGTKYIKQQTDSDDKKN